MMMSSSHRVVSVDSTKRSFVHPLLVRIEIRTTRTSSPLRNRGRQVIPHHRINLPPYADVCFCVTGRASMSALVIRSPYFFGRPRWRFAGGSGIRNSALSRRICPITAIDRSTAQSTSRRFMYHASRTTRIDGKWLAMAPSSALAIVIFPGFP